VFQIDVYLRPTPVIDCGSTSIKETAKQLTEGQQNISDKAKSIFYFVRDRIKYNFYVPSDKRDYYRASRTLEVGEGFCIQKAILHVALSRAIGIPARLHLAAIRSHHVPTKLKELMGGDLFPTHGYAELFIGGKWLRVTPAFDLETCQKNRFVPVEFDGIHDAMLPPYDPSGEPHFEYVQDHGYYDDLPFKKVMSLRVKYLGSDFFERIRQSIELINGDSVKG
jgi:hypothetical protein